MSKTTKTETEPRFTCTNWDPVVRTQYSGIKTIKRKVITQGLWEIDDVGILDEAKQKLREGCIVKIGKGLILAPVMKSDLSMMYPAVHAIGDLYNCLEDKETKVIHCGEEIDGSEMVDELAKRRRKASTNVTPDKMVTCPACGTKFRVGKKNI